MAQLVALLHSDASLLPCLLRRLDALSDLRTGGESLLGLGYFQNGQVLLRKRPAPSPTPLSALGADIQSELFVAATRRVRETGFQEAETQPHRFRSWIFASSSHELPLGDRAQVLATLPEFLARSAEGRSDAELAFLLTLHHVWQETRNLDRLDLEAHTLAQALNRTLSFLDQRAQEAGLPRVCTSALLSNGRQLAAVRRGAPLSYLLIEGLSRCEGCGLEDAALSDEPSARPHLLVKGVALASSPRSEAGGSWVEIPEGHLLSVSRNLSLRLSALEG